MNVSLFSSGLWRFSAHDPHDRFLGDDTQPPNLHAHRRWFMLVVIVFAAAVLAALICGALQSVPIVTAAFANPSSLVDSGVRNSVAVASVRIAALPIGVLVVAMVFRRRCRKAMCSKK